jgi:hypothetical protein
MHNDPFPSFEYLTMTQIGTLFDATCQDVGKWLQDVGVRTAGVPMDKAVRGGLAKHVNDGARQFWAWHKEGAVKLLEAAGHRRAGEPEPVPPPNSISLIGPFTVRPGQSGDNEIVGSDGVPNILVKAGVNVERLAAVLNMAAKCNALK